VGTWLIGSSEARTLLVFTAVVAVAQTLINSGHVEHPPGRVEKAEDTAHRSCQEIAESSTSSSLPYSVCFSAKALRSN